MRTLALLPLAALVPFARLPWTRAAASPLRVAVSTVEASGSLGPAAGDLARLLPADALFTLEGPGLAQLLAEGERSPIARALAADPTVTRLLESAETPPSELLRRGSELLGAPLLPRLASLFSGGVVLGLAPSEEGGRWTLAARADDPQLLRESLDRLLAGLGERAGFPHAFDRPHESIEGADVWFLGELGLARRGDLLVASRDRASLRGALESAAREPVAADGGESRHASGAVLCAWADLEGWAAHAARKPAGEAARNLRGLREAAARPAVQFLLGPALALFGRSTELRAELFLDGEDPRLVVRGTGAPPERYAALLPAAQRDPSPVPPSPELGDEGAELLVYRDLDALFRGRADLFEAEALPRFAEAVSNLSLLLGGMDLGEDVLPGIGKWIRLVAGSLRFETGPVPAQPLPAACLLVELEDGERLGGALVAAFQSAVSIANLERAQQDRRPLLLGVELVEGVEVSRARFLPPAAGDGVDIEHNLAPACAVVGSTFVLGTHEELVARVVRELARGRGSRELAPPRSERLALSSSLLRKALADNVDAISMNKVLEEGATRAEARAELEVVAGLLELVKGLRLDVDAQDPEHLGLTLELDLRSAAEATGGAPREVSR